MSEVQYAGGYQAQAVTSAGAVATVDEVSLSDLPLNEAVVLLMLKRRTADLDAQVSGVMRAIDQQTTDSEAIQKKIEVLQAIDQAIQAAGTDGDRRLDRLSVTIDGQTLPAMRVLEKYGLSEVDLQGQDYQKALRMKGQYAEARAIMDNPEDYPADQVDQARRDAAEAWNFLVDEMGMESATDDIPLDDRMIIKSSAVQSAIAQLETQSRQANSANELQMVRMQTAMQQRSQVITMATQMIKTMSETNQAIARNL